MAAAANRRSRSESPAPAGWVGSFRVPRGTALQGVGRPPSLAPLPKSGIFAALSVWAFVCSFYGCLSPDPVRVFGGRWSMLSSWALLLSATYWCLSAAHVWFWETPLAAQIGPFLEILWPLVFGSATYSAVLFFAVLLPTTTWTEFDPRTRWLCAESAPWRGPPELQLLVCHGVPCLLAYWEVCNLRQLPSPSAARASSTMVNFFIAGFFANSCISYSTLRYPSLLAHATTSFARPAADVIVSIVVLGACRTNTSLGLSTRRRRVQLLAGGVPRRCGLLVELQVGFRWL